MKTPSDELFYLIRSLNPQEKRFFKLYAMRKDVNNSYLILFDTINKLNYYDEKKVKEAFKKKSPIKDFHAVKKYTFEAVLRAMEQYHIADSVVVILQRYLQDIEFLVGKQLLDSAGKIIRTAEKVAVENHQYAYLFTILGWKRKVIIRGLKLNALNEYEKKHYVSELHYINLYKNIVEYRKIEARVMVFLITQLENPDEKTKTELNQILKNPYLKEDKKALSFPAKVMYCRILGDVHMLLGNIEKSYTYYQRAIHYFESAKLVPYERLMLFVKLALSLSQLKKSEELLFVKNAAEKLINHIPGKLQTISLYPPYLILMNNYIDYQRMVFNTKEALSASDEIVYLVEKYASAQGFLLYYGNLLLICLLTGDYHKALSCVNKVLDVEKKGIRLDIISGVKILALIIHYELNNEDVLHSLYRSFYPYFEKQKRQNKAEHILLNFFGKTIYRLPKKEERATNQQNKIKAFLALKEELEACKTEGILNQFDFISWCDSKIQNRPLMDVLRERK